MDEIAKAMLESGKSFNYYNIQHVENFNPNATQVTTNYYGDQFVPKDFVRKEVVSDEKTQPATRNPQLIIDYVMRLHPYYICEEWEEKYETLWKEVLELPVVADKIYDSGGQQAKFNRRMVGNILCLMKVRKVLRPDARANRMAEVLENNMDSPIRGYLGEMPSKEHKEIKMEVEKLIDSFFS